MIETGRLYSLRASGGPAVREELVRRFLPLARKVAMRYLGTSEPLDDLLQVAHPGLIGAVERFEPERGTSFPVVEDSPTPMVLADTLGAEDDGYALVEAAATIRAEMPGLPYHERRALTLRLTEDLTQEKIAWRLGCSQMQISRLMRRSRDTLRQSLSGRAGHRPPVAPTPIRRAG